MYTVYPMPTTDLNFNLEGAQFEYQLCLVSIMQFFMNFFSFSRFVQ